MRCVDSICQQTYKNLEIILVDDGSPDRCPQICEEMRRKDARIKVIHKHNQGLGFARNSGIEIARGEYIAFVDSDDWIARDHIENLFAVAEKNCADLVIGAHTCDMCANNIKPRPVHISEGVYVGEAITEQILFPLIGPDSKYPHDVQIESSSCMNLYRMNLITKYNLRFICEKNAIAEDLVFNFDFVQHCESVAVVNEMGYYYCFNSDSISRSYDPNRTQRTFNFYQLMLARLRMYGLESKCSVRLDRCYLLKIRVACRLIVLSNLGILDKLCKIKVLLNNEITREILNRYPIGDYKFSMRILMWTMRARCAVGVFLLTMIREGIRANRLSKQH